MHFDVTQYGQSERWILEARLKLAAAFLGGLAADPDLGFEHFDYAEASVRFADETLHLLLDTPFAAHETPQVSDNERSVEHVGDNANG